MTQPIQPTEPSSDTATDNATGKAADSATDAGAAVSRRRLLIGAAGTAALAGVGLAVWQQRRSGAQAAPGGSDDLSPLWALQVERPEGGQIVLAGLRGKPLLINFWATWCAPCLREMPEIDRFYREFSPRGWQVLGLAIDGPTPVREFLARVKIGFPIGLAGLDGTELVHSLGNRQGGLPFSVMINASGTLIQRKMGETSFDELAGWAAKA
jgi:thiol-disulfide isomerase/thioredoxin